MRCAPALLALALSATWCITAHSSADSVIDIGAGLVIGNKIADLFSADGTGKMIISAVGDGSKCLDGGDWPTLERDNCTMFSADPFCQSTGELR